VARRAADILELKSCDEASEAAAECRVLRGLIFALSAMTISLMSLVSSEIRFAFAA
jgi:hypothetical protein